MISEGKKQYLPDIVELKLKSENIEQLFVEVGNLILKSRKIINTDAALKEFLNLQKFWVKKGNELIEKEKEFFPKGVFPLCINYCSFLDASGPLMFLGRSANGIDLGKKEFPPSKIFCLVLFHSIESYQRLNQHDAEKEKINIYWNNLLKNKDFIAKFLDLKNFDELPGIIEEIAKIAEKRKHQRYETENIVYCSMFGEKWKNDQKEKARIVNISLSGLLIEHYYPYYQNSILELEPVLENNKLYIWGKVCHTNKFQEEKATRFVSGINITNITENDENVLARYLTKLISPSQSL